MAYEKPITKLSDNINTFRIDHNTLAEAVGDLDNLTTTVDSDIVGAINELDSDIGTITSLATTDKSSVVAAINEINQELHGITDGDGSSLNTDANTLVGAINELNDSIGSGGLNTTQQTLIAAINEHDTELGTITSGAMGTTASTVSTAINELDGRLDSINNTQLNSPEVLADSGYFGGISTTGKLVVGTDLTVGTYLTVTDSSQFQSNLSVLGQITAEDLVVSDSASVRGNLNVLGNVGVSGNLDVQGTVNFIASNTVEIGDNIILLNGDLTGNPPQNTTTDAGLEVNRGSYTNVNLYWDETAKYWVAAHDSDNSLAQIVTTGDSSLVSNTMLVNDHITITDGSTSTDIALNDTITFSNVANETTVTQSGGTVTIGLPNNVDITNDLSIGGAFSVGGNFQVSGDTKVISNFITVLDSNTATGIPSGFDYVAGLRIDRGNASNYNFVYDDSADNWRWYDSDAGGIKYSFLTNDNVTATSPINYSYDSFGNSTFSIDDATTSAKGAASFASADFQVTSGAVSIKTGGVSNTQLAGSITNAKLVNSSITLNSASIALGESLTLGTDSIAEGSTNLYYTTARADSDARHAISVSGDLTYSAATGVISLDVQSVYTSDNFDSDLHAALDGSEFTTDSIGEGINNLYYTADRADSDAKNAISVTDNGGDGSLTYSASTGVITYTGPSASEVRAHFSGTSPVSITDGEISVGNATTSVKGIASFNSTYFSTSSGAVSIKLNGVPNDRLVNSSITINGSSVSLGGSIDLADSAGGLSNGFSSLNSSLAIGDNHSVSGDNVRTTAFGHSSLNAITTGDDNTAIGYKTLENITTTHYNTALGAYAGNQLVSGSGNTALGYGAMGKNATPSTSNNHLYNTAVGMDTLQDLALATATNPCNYNTAVGYGAGKEVGTNVNNTGEGADNTLIGALAGNSLQDGSDNTFVGRGAGSARTSGTNNVIVGADADTASTSGNNNIVIGRNAALSSANTSNEIVLGDTNIDQFRIPGLLTDVTGNQNAANGLVVKNASDRISSDLEVLRYIFHSGDTDTFIDFETDKITIEAGGVEMIEMVEGATDYIDFVDTMRITAGGDLECENDIIAFSSTAISDENLKENIEVIPDALAKVETLKGVTFDWKDKEETSAGLIAQDVEKILPQAVKDKKIRDGEEFKALNYDGVVGLLVEAVKELSARVKELESK